MLLAMSIRWLQYSTGTLGKWNYPAYMGLAAKYSFAFNSVKYLDEDKKGT